MIATFFAALVVMFIVFGAPAVDAFAAWNRKRRTMRREVARPSALPRKLNADLPSGGLVHSSRLLADPRGPRGLSGNTRPAPSRKDIWT